MGETWNAWKDETDDNPLSPARLQMAGETLEAVRDSIDRTMMTIYVGTVDLHGVPYAIYCGEHGSNANTFPEAVAALLAKGGDT